MAIKKAVKAAKKAAVKAVKRAAPKPKPEPVEEAKPVLPMCPENYPHLYDEFGNPK